MDTPFTFNGPIRQLTVGEKMKERVEMEDWKTCFDNCSLPFFLALFIVSPRLVQHDVLNTIPPRKLLRRDRAATHPCSTGIESLILIDTTTQISVCIETAAATCRQAELRGVHGSFSLRRWQRR